MAAAQKPPDPDSTTPAENVSGQHSEGQGGGGQMSTDLHQRVLSELPSMGLDQLMQRARIEDNVGDALSIVVTLTMLGWQKDGGGLWWPLDIVYVHSPMLIMDRPLILRQVIFTQDDETGTRSTIELVNPTAYNAGMATASGG